MLGTSQFFNSLKKKGVGLFAGVPDSSLKDLCAFIDDHCTPREHIITANEGNAVSLVGGYHLATGKIGAVYMQNSGLGNCVNPITSLADPEVYSLPMLLIIGWRGEPGVKDEPQHVKQGRITTGQLDLLEIPYRILDSQSDYDLALSELFEIMYEKSCPVALLVRNNTFTEYKSNKSGKVFSTMRREDAIETILDLIDPEDLVVSTTGKTSRELFELREKRGDDLKDFLTVGSMGHTSSIALGIALGNPARRVICLDGDGSVLMHLGALPIIGSVGTSNLVHVILNNSAHESVGGQPTVAGEMDFAAIAIACGYRGYRCATNSENLKECWRALAQDEGLQMLEVRINMGSRKDLGRPSKTPKENKMAFMNEAVFDGH